MPGKKMLRKSPKPRLAKVGVNLIAASTRSTRTAGVPNASLQRKEGKSPSTKV